MLIEYTVLGPAKETVEKASRFPVIEEELPECEDLHEEDPEEYHEALMMEVASYE